VLWRALAHLQERIRIALREESDVQPSAYMPRGPLFSCTSDILPSDQLLEQVLIEGFEGLLISLSPIRRSVLRSRFGYCAARLTLEEVGAAHGFTRERARQLEKAGEALLPNCFRLDHATIRRAIGGLAESNLQERLPLLASLFEGPRSLENFLEIVGALDDRFLTERQQTGEDRTAKRFLLELFARCGGAILESVLRSELASGLGWSDKRAAACIQRLLKTNDLFRFRNGLRPRFLPRKEAVAHVLAAFPSGLPWQDLARAVRNSGVCRSEFQTDRLDQSISDNDFIYLCERGCYRHLRYTSVAPGQAQADLELLRALALSSGSDSHGLRTIYSRSSGHFSLPYFELRYEVSVHGQEFGLYFTGRSGTDTLALAPIQSLVTLRQQVLNVVGHSPEPVSAMDLVEHLRQTYPALVYSALGRLRRARQFLDTTPGGFTTRRVRSFPSSVRALARCSW